METCKYCGEEKVTIDENHKPPLYECKHCQARYTTTIFGYPVKVSVATATDPQAKLKICGYCRRNDNEHLGYIQDKDAQVYGCPHCGQTIAYFEDDDRIETMRWNHKWAQTMPQPEKWRKYFED